MSLTIIEPSGIQVKLSEPQSKALLSKLIGNSDPRVSACVSCNSAVLAAEPFGLILDELSINNALDSDITRSLIDLLENSESVHIYIWEENDCIHNLWRDPLASEWSSVTGEKRLHH